MEMILTGIENKNEYYTNHYFTSIFQDNAEDTIKKWKQKEKQEEMIDFYDKKNEQVVALQSKLQEEKNELKSQLGEMLGSDKVFLKKTLSDKKKS